MQPNLLFVDDRNGHTRTERQKFKLHVSDFRSVVRLSGLEVDQRILWRRSQRDCLYSEEHLFHLPT